MYTTITNYFDTIVMLFMLYITLFKSKALIFASYLYRSTNVLYNIADYVNIKHIKRTAQIESAL